MCRPPPIGRPLCLNRCHYPAPNARRDIYRHRLAEAAADGPCVYIAKTVGIPPIRADIGHSSVDMASNVLRLQAVQVRIGALPHSRQSSVAPRVGDLSPAHRPAASIGKEHRRAARYSAPSTAPRRRPGVCASGGDGDGGLPPCLRTALIMRRARPRSGSRRWPPATSGSAQCTSKWLSGMMRSCAVNRRRGAGSSATSEARRRWIMPRPTRARRWPRQVPRLCACRGVTEGDEAMCSRFFVRV